MTLQEFNQSSKEAQKIHLKNCCGSEKWVQSVTEGIPYGDVQTLLNQGQYLWYNECGQSDWLEAFTHHPRIGDKNNIGEKVRDTIHLAVGEQSGVEENNAPLLDRLRVANSEYEAKFGFTFIVFASGRSGDEMLGLLKGRLGNPVHDEMRIAMGEQWKITLLRLKKLFSGENFSPEKSAITTHILDTSAGKPAQGVNVSLFKHTNGDWQKIASGITNEDGRIAELLPAGVMPELNMYKLVFDTAAYFTANGQSFFYPEVQIIFNIADKSHYHVPLLLNPFGYSTYRGS